MKHMDYHIFGLQWKSFDTKGTMAINHTATVAAKRKQGKKSSNWFELEGGFLFTTAQVTVNTVIGASVMS